MPGGLEVRGPAHQAFGGLPLVPRAVHNHLYLRVVRRAPAVLPRRRRVLRLGVVHVAPGDAAAADGARGVRQQPGVDALGVEGVAAGGQDAEQLGGVEGAQAHRALGGAAHVDVTVAEPDRRKRAHRGAAEPRAAAVARGGREAEAQAAGPLAGAALLAVLGVDEEEEERQQHGREHAHDDGRVHGRQRRRWQRRWSHLRRRRRRLHGLARKRRQRRRRGRHPVSIMAGAPMNRSRSRERICMSWGGSETESWRRAGLPSELARLKNSASYL
ncbi:hypothetical protein ZEAMMB73_Zm00001d026493 [Zea mays]|jgi:hypothetical protein|uniref:Uncharacterized protein n=1 Tax=Zea mays TaxID=4577 RepID=C0P729_MAIZE|nr:unknown [Zea mays]AQK46789.1 hypothetical protein ZEAMMB73_Zm00001d026493 [Zea mays]